MNSQDIKKFLKELSDDDLDKLPKLIEKEIGKRMRHLPVGTEVITLEAGFSGGAGRRCEFLGFVKKGEPSSNGSVYGDDYATFGYGKNVHWLLDPEEMASSIKVVKKK